MATAPTTALDNTDEHSTTALYRAAIGDISNGYYLPRFTRFEAADRPGLSWNWAAALSTLNWLMFRQLWHAALVYSGSIVALALLLFGIGKLVFQFSEGTQWGLLAALVGLAFVVPGLGGNALYYLATRQRVQNALAKNQTVPEACAQLTQEASTRKGLIILATCNAVALAVGAQSYAMFSGFEPLPAGTPVPVQTAPEARHIASGRAVDATAAESVKPAASAATSPTPAPAASAPSAAASAAGNARQSASSAAPAATSASAAASATTVAPKAAITASAPASAPQAKVAAAVALAAAPASSASASSPARPSLQTPAPAPTASSSAPKTTAKATSAPSSTQKAGALPTPLRSAAAANAAREVAAALGQPAPVAQVTPRAVATPSTASASGGRFVVNVGLFADSNNARNALVKLMDAELPVVSKEVRFPKGNRTRIQVGPFDTLAEADTAADKVRALELEARVAPAP